MGLLRAETPAPSSRSRTISARPRQLNALLDVTATPLQGVIDDETAIVSVPIRLRRAGREIRMVIGGIDPFAASKPDPRLIKLLLNARRFNATLVTHFRPTIWSGLWA